jgi:hypothetical protein
MDGLKIKNIVMKSMKNNEVKAIRNYIFKLRETLNHWFEILLYINVIYR